MGLENFAREDCSRAELASRIILRLTAVRRGDRGRSSRAFLNAGRAAAGGPSRQQILIGGLQAIAKIGIFSGDAVGQGMQIGFAGDNRALRAQSFRYGGIFARDFAFLGVVAGSSGGVESFEVEA